jgi:hypothetical protein
MEHVQTGAPRHPLREIHWSRWIPQDVATIHDTISSDRRGGGSGYCRPSCSVNLAPFSPTNNCDIISMAFYAVVV